MRLFKAEMQAALIRLTTVESALEASNLETARADSATRATTRPMQQACQQHSGCDPFGSLYPTPSASASRRPGMAFYVIRTRDAAVPTTTQSSVVRLQIRRLDRQMQSAQAAIGRLEAQVEAIRLDSQTQSAQAAIRRLEAQVEAIRRSVEAVPVATAVGDGAPQGNALRLRV